MATRTWNAYWIWPEQEEQPQSNVYYYFRREFDLAETPAGCKLYITADTRYEVYINGEKLGSGPPQSVPYYYYYDVYEAEPWLRKGRNCIAVIVYHMGEETPGGLLLELADACGNTLLASDESFRALRADAWRQNTYHFRMSYYTPYQEMYDARKEPAGWKRAGFDDRQWGKVRRLSGLRCDRPPAVAPWTSLNERDIPFMTESKQFAAAVAYTEESLDMMNRMRPEDLSIGLSIAGQPLKYATVLNPEKLLEPAGGAAVRCSTEHLNREFDGVYNPAIVLDFGRSINAYLEIELTGPAGGIVEIGYAERLVNGRFHNATEGQFADRYTMKEGWQRYRPFTWKSFRYVKLLFRNCFRPVTLHCVQAAVTSYPFRDAGFFKSNDDKLNRLFDICRYTIKLCSNESIMDTPWREQAQFTGDAAAVTIGGICACFGDTRLAAKFLRQSAANQLPTGFLTNVTNSLAVKSNADWRTVHPDYSLWWVYGLWHHYLYTGEEEWIHRYYPHAVKIAQAILQYQGPSGMIENMPYAVFIDWAAVDRRGICAPLNAIAFGILGLVERMAALKGDRFTEHWLKTSRAKMRESFVQTLYCPKRQVIADARVEGALSERISEHANMAAILFGLVEPETAASLISKFYEERSVEYTECQPFFSKFVLQALTKAGRADLALNIIRERWVKRMVDRGASSTYEEWGLHGSWRSGDYVPIIRTQSHAWSAYPAEYLIRGLCDMEILEPGCRRIRLRQPGVDLEYEASYPTPLGNLRFRCTKGRLIAEPPQGMEIELEQ